METLIWIATWLGCTALLMREVVKQMSPEKAIIIQTFTDKNGDTIGILVKYIRSGRIRYVGIEDCDTVSKSEFKDINKREKNDETNR